MKRFLRYPSSRRYKKWQGSSRRARWKPSNANARNAKRSRSPKRTEGPDLARGCDGTPGTRRAHAISAPPVVGRAGSRRVMAIGPSAFPPSTHSARFRAPARTRAVNATACTRARGTMRSAPDPGRVFWCGRSPPLETVSPPSPALAQRPPSARRASKRVVRRGRARAANASRRAVPARACRVSSPGPRRAPVP